jgi:hypothetical protein
LFDRRIVRDRTLTRVRERDAQILRAVDQRRQARLDDSRRVAAARRQIECERFVVFGNAECVQRSFYLSACGRGSVLRSRRRISGKNRLTLGQHHDDEHPQG